MKNYAKQVISDIRTYTILSRNENYKQRLEEAYKYLKSKGINSYEDFKSRTDLLVGAFTYTEITIFDRISDPEYLQNMSSAMFTINNSLEDYISNPHIGDDLASWGRLGHTPKRAELINRGFIINGLTEEEAQNKFR